jgi:hypothetical protein
VSDTSEDIRAILARRHDNGADFWTTPDGRIYVGNPYSTIGSLGMLHELGVAKSHEAVQGGMQAILAACRDDGQIRVAPSAPPYPCYSAEGARMLCRFGFAKHASVLRTVAHLVAGVHETGGWRCNFTKFGKGPETRCSNPGATLYVLDVLRLYPKYRKGNASADAAVGFLLDHWDSRKPIGACHWGIGDAFIQVEYPFIRYNLFYYVYVLSFFSRASGDRRFRAAFAALGEKLDVTGNVVVEKPHRALKGLRFCAKGEPSRPATARWREITRKMRV